MSSTVPWKAVVCLLVVVVVVIISNCQATSNAYDWMPYDAFDDINDRYQAITAQNCKSKPASELRLPADSVGQQPKYNRLLSYIVYPNRTKLLHVHNMALNRAFFYSYMFQKLNKTETFMMQPGMLYYYFSNIAVVSANENNINGTGIMFDNNASFANWYKTLPFNRTLPLFGPRAYRFDDYNEPVNWIREPTNHTINCDDYGTGPQSNYTLKSYKINGWYDLFLPDGWDKKGLDSVRKFSYDIGVKYSNETGKFSPDEFLGKVLFGPPSPGQKETQWLPVLFTEPYFDCGRLNRWIISGVSPVVDQVPRYLDWFHLRRETFVAVAVVDMEFLAVDFNPCPQSDGNDPPNYFFNTSRCKPTTVCDPLYGWGFRRGGYICMCKPGYRLPPWQYGPFLGIEIDSATEEEYKNGFDCVPVQLRQVIPIIRSNATAGTPNVPMGTVTNRKKRSADEDEEWPGGDPTFFQPPEHAKKTYRAAQRVRKDVLESRILAKKLRFLRAVGLRQIEQKRKKRSIIVPRVSYPQRVDAVSNKKVSYVPRYKRDTTHSRKKRQSFDQKGYDRMMQILLHKDSINADNCQNFKPDDLFLPGDVGYNVEKLFSNQARTALRLSHFLSNFLQNVDLYEEYGNLRGDRLINTEQVFGEVLANTMGDLQIKGSGVFFDIDKFRGPDGMTREYFGPYAWRYEKTDPTAGPESNVANTHFRAIDYAGFETPYISEPWFKNVKERWQSNTYGLTKFIQKPMIRSDINGTSLVKFELFPLYFRAPKEEDGLWSAPYFDCDGYVNDWIVTYSTPFFGLNSVATDIEFKGVVVVDVQLNQLDINQCPQDYFVPNAFKDTARCHYDTTYCEYIAGKKFVRGNYKCNCKEGYEYPFNDRAWYFDGQMMEEEYRKKTVGDKNSRYDNLRCRISAASLVSVSWLTGFIVSLLSILLI